MQSQRNSRWLAGQLILPFLLFALLFGSSCRRLLVTRDNSIPRLPENLVDEDFNGLIARLKQFTEITALRSSRMYLQFRDSQAAERYPEADAILVLQRPDKIRLVIQAPVLGSKVADMVSESSRFKVAIYYEKYRRFLIGSNEADYSRMRAKLGKEEQQSALLNARPFHFTDALLMKPLHLDDARFIYSLEEALLDEPDPAKNAKKGARIFRSYYVISEQEAAAQPGAPARVRRRFWFDRTQQLQFVRQQIFDARGLVVTEVQYSGYARLSEDSSILWPGVILVSRPRDGYAARLSFTAGSFEVNPDFGEAKPFVLENTDGLPETDLDKQPRL